MFSTPLHTLEQRAEFMDLFGRRADDVGDDELSAPRRPSRHPVVMVRAGRIIRRLSPVAVPQAARSFNTEDNLAALATAFGRRLSEAGLVVTSDQLERYARVLGSSKPGSRRSLYFATRAIFLPDIEQVATFNGVFAEVFGAPAGTDRYRERTPEAAVAHA